MDSHKFQNGFTLIELMIVVSIIGLLAAVAIPSYQDYVVRTRVSEGLSVASDAKMAIAETFQSRGVWPSGNTTAGLASAASIVGNNVASITVGLNGTGISTITILYSVDTNISGDTVILTAEDARGSITWDCLGGTVAGEYRPANCR